MVCDIAHQNKSREFIVIVVLFYFIFAIDLRSSVKFVIINNDMSAHLNINNKHTLNMKCRKLIKEDPITTTNSENNTMTS